MVFGVFITSVRLTLFVSILCGVIAGPGISYGLMVMHSQKDTVANFEKRLQAVPNFQGQAQCAKEGLLLKGTLTQVVNIEGKGQIKTAIPVNFLFEGIRSCHDQFYPVQSTLEARIHANATEVVEYTNRAILKDKHTAKAVGELLFKVSQ